MKGTLLFSIMLLLFTSGNPTKEKSKSAEEKESTHRDTKIVEINPQRMPELKISKNNAVLERFPIHIIKPSKDKHYTILMAPEPKGFNSNMPMVDPLKKNPQLPYIMMDGSKVLRIPNKP